MPCSQEDDDKVLNIKANIVPGASLENWCDCTGLQLVLGLPIKIPKDLFWYASDTNCLRTLSPADYLVLAEDVCETGAGFRPAPVCIGQFFTLQRIVEQTFRLLIIFAFLDLKSTQPIACFRAIVFHLN